MNRTLHLRTLTYRLLHRMAALSFGLLLCSSCSLNDQPQLSASSISATRTVEGLGEFRLDEEDMWEAHVEVDGEEVKVYLHTYQTDFDTLSEYAKRVLARRPLPDSPMLADVKDGIDSLAWKFKQFKFDASRIDLQKFRVERLVIGKDFDGPDIELGINLIYPGDANQWHLKYFREGDNGSLNWIPKTD